jgi:hypothetical protein
MWSSLFILAVLLLCSGRPAPIDTQSLDPAQQSTDVWASVIANVAPLVALLGEKNAKEYMRTIYVWHQLLLLSCAPLGILAITVSSIRLSGPPFLKRLVGQDSERRSEALIEVTPLSVRPATSVHTSCCRNRDIPQHRQCCFCWRTCPRGGLQPSYQGF